MATDAKTLQEILEQVMVFSPQEINTALRFAASLLNLILITSVGTFTRGMIFPKEHTTKQSVGFSIISGFLALAIKELIFKESNVDLALMAIICFSLGFFMPAFKRWMKGKKLFRVFARAYKKTKGFTESVMDEVADEMEKEDKEDEKKEDEKKEND